MKKSYLLNLSIVLAIGLLSQGCFTYHQVGTAAENSIEMTNTQKAQTSHHFTKTKTVSHFLWGLVSPDNSGYDALVSEAVGENNGSKAVNVRVKYQQTFVNGLLGAITLGIYAPFTLTVEGDVVQ